jgi:hypothetical protein
VSGVLTVSETTSLPFHAALRELLEHHKIADTPGMPKSLQQLADRTQRLDPEGGWSKANIQRLASRPENRVWRPPTLRNMQIIAEAFGLPHTYWCEYREHLAAERAREVTAEVGLEPVLRALSVLADQHRSRG